MDLLRQHKIQEQMEVNKDDKTTASSVTEDQPQSDIEMEPRSNRRTESVEETLQSFIRA